MVPLYILLLYFKLFLFLRWSFIMLSFYFSFQGGWANRHATGRHPYPRPFGNYFKGPCRTSVGLECLHGVVVGDIWDRDLSPDDDVPAYM